MRAALLALVLAACCPDEEAPRHIWQDAVEAVAMAQCSVWIECGAETAQDWQTCVSDLVWDTCNTLLDQGVSCLSEYPVQRNFEYVQQCADWYASVPCGTYVPACHI